MEGLIQLTGTFTGFSSDRLVGILVEGQRKRLKWFYCEDALLLESLARLKKGTALGVSVENRIEENRIYLRAIFPAK